MSDFVRVVEVGPRDGLQNEKTRGCHRRQDRAGRPAFGDRPCAPSRPPVSSARAWVPQLADAAEVFAGIQRRPGVAYPVLVPNEQGYERALAAGVGEVAVFTAASEAFNRANTNAGIDESIERFRPILARAAQDGIKVRGYVSTVLGCPYQGEVPVAAVVDVARGCTRWAATKSRWATPSASAPRPRRDGCWRRSPAKYR